MITVFSRSGTDDERALALLIDFRRVPAAGLQKFVRRRGRIGQPSRFVATGDYWRVRCRPTLDRKAW